MQPNIGSPQAIRNSYGYAYQEGFHPRTPQSKGFPTQSNYFHPQGFNEKLTTSIRNIDSKGTLIESPSHKKLNPAEGSPTTFGLANFNESKFKPYFPSNSDVKQQQQMSESLLRVSCSNVVRRFESGNNLASSLRNTTNFNLVNKFSTGLTNQQKKTSEESNHLKSTPNLKQNQFEVPSPTSANSLKQTDRMRNGHGFASKTPPKIFGEKKLDQSVKFASKTPIKYKNSPVNSNKNSAISKVSTQVEEKKLFKSLNEIVQIKAKEKLALQTSRAMKKQSKIINGFQMGKLLGKGKFGEVNLARHHQTGFFAALKKIVKNKVIQYQMIGQFCNEIKLHSCLDHPNIVRFYGCFQDKEDIYLALQYMNGGTLFDYLNEVNYLNVREAVQYLRDIIEAIIYMHQKSIAHRDIKPENVVISSEGVAKLCDFGWAAVVETSRKTYCGTFDYAPPQILERKNYDTSVDIWCIGVLTYELLTGKVPFEGEQRTTVMQKILNVDKNKINYPVDIPQEAKEFIEALVQKDPALRPKSQDLLKFKLFNLYPSKYKGRAFA